MDLKDMKCSHDVRSQDVCSPSQQEYPYGLKLYIDNESLKKLGIEELPEVGSEVAIKAVAVVCGTTQNENKDGVYKSLDVQIVKLALGGPKKESSEEITKAFYKS